MKRKRRKKRYGLSWIRWQIKLYRLKKESKIFWASCEKRLRPIHGDNWHEHIIIGG